MSPEESVRRVVKTSIAVLTGRREGDLRTWLRPIQLRCMILTFSGQSRRSRSSRRRSAYVVMRIIHWRRLRRKTGKLLMSERPLGGDLLVGQHRAL